MSDPFVASPVDYLRRNYRILRSDEANDTYIIATSFDAKISANFKIMINERIAMIFVELFNLERIPVDLHLDLLLEISSAAVFGIGFIPGDTIELVNIIFPSFSSEEEFKILLDMMNEDFNNVIDHIKEVKPEIMRFVS